MELGPRGTPAPPSVAPPARTFPQLRQWCRRRSRVKGERQAEHWLHVLSGTHSGRRRVPDGQNVGKSGTPRPPSPPRPQETPRLHPRPWVPRGPWVPRSLSAEPAPGTTWQLFLCAWGCPGQPGPPRQDRDRLRPSLMPCPGARAPWAAPYLPSGARLPPRGCSTGGSRSHKEHPSHMGHHAFPLRGQGMWWSGQTGAGLSPKGLGTIAALSQRLGTGDGQGREEPSLVAPGVTHGWHLAPPRAPPVRQ